MSAPGLSAAIVVAAYAGLLVILTVPLIIEFLELGRPPSGLLLAAIAVSAAAKLLWKPSTG